MDQSGCRALCARYLDQSGMSPIRQNSCGCTSYLTAVKMQGVILNHSGAQVKNLSEAAVAERFFGLRPQNDKPAKSVRRTTSHVWPSHVWPSHRF